MGAEPLDPKTGEAPLCDGLDVIKELNRIFEQPNSVQYQYAKDHNKFGTVPNAADNYRLLIDAYDYAGVPVGPRWAAYLRILGTVVPQGPQNIYDIAQTRNNALTNDGGVQTATHAPQHGGHVHTTRGSGAQPSLISSPYPL
ncbi:hypothetical protein [Bradyrhizobium sp.]